MRLREHEFGGLKKPFTQSPPPRVKRILVTVLRPSRRGRTARGGEQTVGFKHLAFEVPDIDAAIEKLRGDGVEPDPINDCANLSHGLRICFFKDPDGNILELMEGWQDETF